MEDLTIVKNEHKKEMPTKEQIRAYLENASDEDIRWVIHNISSKAMTSLNRAIREEKR